MTVDAHPRGNSPMAMADRLAAASAATSVMSSQHVSNPSMSQFGGSMVKNGGGPGSQVGGGSGSAMTGAQGSNYFDRISKLSERLSGLQVHTEQRNIVFSFTTASVKFVPKVTATDSEGNQNFRGFTRQKDKTLYICSPCGLGTREELAV